MKRNWEYKKLGDVCDYPNQRIAIKDLCVGEYVGVENLVKNRGGLVQSTVMPDADNSIEFHVGDVLIGNIRPYLRKIWLADFNGGASGDVVVVRVKKEFGNKLQPSYLYKVLSSEKFFEYDNSNTKGAKMPRGDRNIIAKYLIPVPPLEEQSRIVAELDLLTGIIDKQNAQLKELDNLAQAIFYDMFGDPAVNEKRWDQKPFETICSGMTKGPFGSDIKKDLFVPRSNSTYKVYIQINAIRKNETLGDYYITKEYFEEKMHRFEVKPGDYIITCDGTLGKYIRLSESMERGIISASLLKLTLNKSVSPEYFEALWDNYILDNMKNQARNAALIHLPSAKVIGKTLIPVPPLALQQSFAEKIQSIEKQKETIRASIADTQKLLDYTMDKYFG